MISYRLLPGRRLPLPHIHIIVDIRLGLAASHLLVHHHLSFHVCSCMKPVCTGMLHILSRVCTPIGGHGSRCRSWRRLWGRVPHGRRRRRSRGGSSPPGQVEVGPPWRGCSDEVGSVRGDLQLTGRTGGVGGRARTSRAHSWPGRSRPWEGPLSSEVVDIAALLLSDRHHIVHPDPVLPAQLPMVTPRCLLRWGHRSVNVGAWRIPRRPMLHRELYSITWVPSEGSIDIGIGVRCFSGSDRIVLVHWPMGHPSHNGAGFCCNSLVFKPLLRGMWISQRAIFRDPATARAGRMPLQIGRAHV